MSYGRRLHNIIGSARGTGARLRSQPVALRLRRAWGHALGGGGRERGGAWPDQHQIFSPSLSSLAIVVVAVVARRYHSRPFTVVNLSTIAFADSTMNQYKFDRRFGLETRGRQSQRAPRIHLDSERDAGAERATTLRH